MMKDRFVHQLKVLKKKPKIIFAGLVGILALFGALILPQKKLSSEMVEKERVFALSAIASVLALSKEIKEIHSMDDKLSMDDEIRQLTQCKKNFSEISALLKDTSKAKMGAQFISTVRKTSEFFIDYCNHRTDVLYKIEAMEISDNFDTDKVENILRNNEEYRVQAKQWQEKIIKTIPQAFSEWRAVLSREDGDLIDDVIHEDFQAELEKFSDQLDYIDEKDGMLHVKLYPHEWIAIKIDEQSFFLGTKKAKKIEQLR